MVNLMEHLTANHSPQAIDPNPLFSPFNSQTGCHVFDSWKKILLVQVKYNNQHIHQLSKRCMEFGATTKA